MRKTESELKVVIANVFKINPQTIDDNTSPDTIEEWDSIKHLTLVLALEEFFNISFTEEQTVEILSYALIKAVLEEHGITFVNEE